MEDKMIKVNLEDKRICIKVDDAEYCFTDNKGQINMEDIISFFNNVDIEIINGEITYAPIENESVKNGLKLFLDELLGKLCAEKAKVQNCEND